MRFLNVEAFGMDIGPSRLRQQVKKTLFKKNRGGIWKIDELKLLNYYLRKINSVTHSLLNHKIENEKLKVKSWCTKFIQRKAFAFMN